jgi:hypothetical protein
MNIFPTGLFTLYVDTQATELPQDGIEIGRLL